MNKIADLKKMFERIGNAEARAEYKRIKKAEKLYLGAVEKAGYAYINRKIVASRREEVDADEEIQYNRKYFKFLHKNFPTEKESGSEAHRLAVWWTRQLDVQTGDQTLISMNDRWYLVECFDDALNNYQVEEFITKAEFEKIYKEIKEYGRSGKIKSVSGGVDRIDSLNRQSYSLKERKSSSIDYETQHGREDNQIQRVGKKQVEGGKRPSSDGDGDSSGGGANRQGQPINFSLKESVANSSRTKIGDMDSGSDSRYIYFYEAIDPDNDGRATDYRVVAKVSFANKKLINEWYSEVKTNNERNHASVYESIDEYERTRKEYQGDNATFVEQSSRNGRGSEVHQGKSEGDGKRNTQKGDGSSQGVKYSLKESVEKDVLADEEIRYNFKGKRVASYINNKLSTPTLSSIRNELYKLYDGVESGIADGFAIEIGNDVYIVDSGKDNGKIDVGVRGKRHISDPISRKEFIRRKNGKSIQQGNISDGLSSKFGNEYDDDWNSNRGRKLGEQLSTDKTKSQNQQSGISTQNATNGGERLNFSLKESVEKDSKGKILTEGQVEFFRDSKARDKRGRLQVVYHGTEGEFYTFDKTYRGSVTGTKDAKLGFFFTTSRKVARDYAIEAYDHKMYNLMHEIANGDPDVLELLGLVDGYKELAATEEIKEFGRLAEKGERFEHDIYKLYLNIKNPLEVDFQGKPYKKGAMLKLVTRALTEKRDGVIIRNMDDTIDFSGEISDVFVAFEPNQIKLTTNKNPSNFEDIRYSLKADISQYTEKEYNDFGWARVNGVLSMRENADFRSKYAKIKSGQDKAVRTKNGEIIVAVNDGEEKSFGVDNVLVYAKGSLANYKINKIVKINLDNETSIEIVRSEIYEREKSWTRASDFYADLYEGELVREYTVEAFQSYQELKRAEWERGGRQESGRIDEDYQRERDGSGNFGENQENVRFSLKADISQYTEKEYNDFGWARVNGVLSMRENADFRSKYAKIKSGQDKAVRTKNGEIIVAVNDGEEKSFGVDNVLVYAKGSLANYKINKVIKINLDNETSIEIVRSKIYEIETDRREYAYTAGEIIETYFGQEIISEYSVGDFSSYQEIKTERRRQGRRNESGSVDEDYQRVQDGSGNFGENQENVRFSLKADISQYTEKKYNDFGWARVNGVLSMRENADFRSKYAKIKSGQDKAVRTKNGEIIVAVNDDEEKSFGVDNVLVYAKGSLANYKINKIVKINLDNETEIDIVRSDIYEQERIGNDETIAVIKSMYGETLISEFAQQDMLHNWSYKELKRRQRSGNESGRIDEDYQRVQDGNRNLGENQENVRFSLKADISQYTEKEYNDFGWARVNGVLSMRENADFKSKYGEIKFGKQKQIHRTAKGEIIVAVNDMEKGKFGINNVLVFAKGTYENYKITRVIRLKSSSETHLDIVRGFIYEYEKDTNAQTRYTLKELYGEELIEQYDSRDFDDYRTSKARARARGRGTQSVGSEQDSGNGGIGEGNFDGDSEVGEVKFSLKDKNFHHFSDGQLKKLRANYTQSKVYKRNLNRTAYVRIGFLFFYA